MDCRVRLVLAIHNHQPVGNFDGVIEEAYQDSYLPFLEVLKDYPELPISLHTSGCLMEWLDEHHPEYLDQVRELVERGQIEIIGGPFYEPILASIPRHDRVGQIRAYSQFLKSRLGVDVKGMWVPERVWEQSFAGDITEAGIEYTIVDDFHFRCAGLPEDELHGYYLTEDQGRLLKMFPGSERLRYTIPFEDPQQTINHLGEIANRHPGTVVAFGDDGEKFGTWPGTKDHVYRDGWLRRFFDALMANRDWLRVSTLAEAVHEVAPLGKCYLPDSSYREMTEWALPTVRQHEYHDIEHEMEHDGRWPAIKQFIRGGFWRNFLAKYPESNEMYCRVWEISNRLRELESTVVGQGQPELLNVARQGLYRGECNCPYWHGAFGGLYLPHLRNAIYSQLIAADTALEKLERHADHWLDVSVDDFNLDARKEIRLSNHRLVGYISPARGGHLYELDVRSIGHNLLATLNRRPEPYHQKILDFAANGGNNGDQGEVTSIHDLVHFKQPDLDKQIAYDSTPRKMLVDHFLAEGTSAEDFRKGAGQIGDFVEGVFQAKLRTSPERIDVVMSREGYVGDQKISMTKVVSLSQSSPSELEVSYEIDHLPEGQTFRLAVECNFAGMPADAGDRYFYNGDGERMGHLGTMLDLTPTSRIGLVDEWLGIDVALHLDAAANFWTFPIQTVSQSESGFELVHQSTAVVPVFHVTADQNGRWSTRFNISIDTAAAQARQLAESNEPVKVGL